MQKIIPFLWYDDRAEEAVDFYISIFKNSKIGEISRYGEASEEVSGKPAGSIMTIEFQLEGQDFIAINGGPDFKFTPAVSFAINCNNQEEIDQYWEKLSEGGEKGPCGWLTDKFGLSWQVTPKILDEMLRDEDPQKSERVMKAMLQMNKIDIEALKRAYKNK